jgi:Ca2+-dependent lipid-binding protein
MVEQIHLSLKANNLPNKEGGIFGGVSDPFAVLTVYPTSQNREMDPIRLGKTEVVKNNLNPDWVKIFSLPKEDFVNHLSCSVNVKIYDHNSNSDHVEMASATFDLDTVLKAKGNCLTKELKRGGSIQLRAEEAVGHGFLRLRLSGVELKNTEGFMRVSDPFYQFERKDVGLRGTEWNVVHRSETIMDDLNPKWKEEKIALSILCKGDQHSVLRFSVMDYEKSGEHVLMGQVEMSVNDFIKKFKAEELFDLMRKGKDTSRGKIVIHVASIDLTNF